MIELLQQIFEVCIVPLLGVLTAYAITLVKKKTEEVNTKISDETLKKYTDMLSQTIQDCVIATNQTYVNSLKEKNAFTKEAQIEAFNQTYRKVMSIITDEAKKQLITVYGDLNVYIATKIEAEVNLNKEENHGQK